MPPNTDRSRHRAYASKMANTTSGTSEQCRDCGGISGRFGSGGGEIPATNWLIKSGIESDTNGTWGDGELTVIFNNVYSDSLTGNGIKEFSVNGTPQPRSYVLGQGLNYFLYLQFETFITINNPPAGLPPIAVTAEFGGVSSYTGLRTDFDWKVVPTPGTAVLFSGSLLMLARRRRR